MRNSTQVSYRTKPTSLQKPLRCEGKNTEQNIGLHKKRLPLLGGTCCQHPLCAWLPGQGWCSHSAGPFLSHRLVLTWCNAKPYGYRTSRLRIKDRVTPGKESIQKETPPKKLRCPLPRLQGNTRSQHYTTPPATLFQHIHKQLHFQRGHVLTCQASAGL